jgi:hypothetical protein
MKYEWWFAWRPVELRGPHEWDRMRATGHDARWVWLRWVRRMRCEPQYYYALLEKNQR